MSIQQEQPKFKRSFLIFNLEDPGFSTGYDLSGYIRIEIEGINGKIKTSIQNLKNNEGKFHYRFYMIRSKDNVFNAINCGEVDVKNNRGQLEFKFNIDNVKSSGIPFSEFNVFAIFVELNGEENKRIICPLVAYKDKKVEWRNSSLYNMNNKNEVTPKINDVDKIKKSEDNSPKVTNDDMSKKSVNAPKIANVEKLKKRLDSAFESFDPFNSKRKDYIWWKSGSPVELNDILYECGIRTPLLFNPMVMMSHFKYRHLIFGIYKDSVNLQEYLICGVPGVNNTDEIPFGDLCKWAPIKGGKEKNDDFGYWLIYIDPESGNFIRF